MVEPQQVAHYSLETFVEEQARAYAGGLEQMIKPLLEASGEYDTSLNDRVGAVLYGTAMFHLNGVPEFVTNVYEASNSNVPITLDSIAQIAKSTYGEGVRGSDMYLRKVEEVGSLYLEQVFNGIDQDSDLNAEQKDQMRAITIMTMNLHLGSQIENALRMYGEISKKYQLILGKMQEQAKQMFPPSN